MSKATEYDTDDSDFFVRPQLMRAPQKDRTKNLMKVGVSSSNDQSVNTSSAACSTVEFKASSTTHSSAEKKSQVMQLRPPRGDDESSASSSDDESSISSTTSEQESPSPPPERQYVQLPAGYLPKCDDCDEAEKLARKRRCDELIALSAKIVREAKEAANRRPLKWAEPTFNPFSSSSTSTSKSPTVLQQVRSTSLRRPTPQEVQEESIQCDLPFFKRRRSDSLSNK